MTTTEHTVSGVTANNRVLLVLETGRTIRISDGVLDNNDGDVGYRFECTIDNIADYVLIQEDDPITVSFCGEDYRLFVKNRTSTRDAPGKVTMKITANSAVERLGAPYAANISYEQERAMLASEVVAELVEIDFTYDIVDWLLPAGRLQVERASPLAAVQQIAEAAGGVVDGLPDGSLVVRVPYPYPMDSLDAATVLHHYEDEYDNLSSTTSTAERDGANRFRIREGDAVFADTLEWVPDETQPDADTQVGTLRAYLSPYRDTARIQHLGGALWFVPGPAETAYLEEMVEFTAGVGRTHRPIAELLTVDWVTTALGAPSFEPYSTALTTNTITNAGYGLAKISYNTKYLTARAGGVPAPLNEYGVGPLDSYAYFIVEDTNGH